MKKVEHFKSMIKAGKKAPATATDVVNDIQDPNSEPSISPDEMPVQSQSVLNKGSNMTPNTWFHYDHPEHGKIEVSAHHDGKKAHIVGVGAPGDVHIHPTKDAGMSKEHMNAMSAHAHKLGPGQHMKKDEMKKSWTAEEIVTQALKNVQAKREELKKAEEMKRERDPEDTGAIYNKEQEVGNQNDIQEAAKREHAQENGKKLKEYMEKAKNKSEKAAKSPIEDK